ncbi:hypothetical protein [Sphingobium sp.]|uniref:hypothetical protein n=1 Tax=Sphingobium sp. TaxID=1912891 RepID=UPI000DB80687|nr:hypothetical protein [Sphingobium sp.]PZU71061.1 MAG: hypothetical protein DI540_01000 [Sphingobium sp.]
MTISLISDINASAPGLPIRVRDNYLSGLPQVSQDVVDGLFLFSTDHPFSWPKQGQPLAADVVRNLAGIDDGVVAVETQSSSGPLAWDAATKSVSFAAVKRGATGFRTPANFIADEFTDAQNFLLGAVVKLPTLASWPVSKGSVNGVAGDSSSVSGPPDNQVWFGSIAMVRGNDSGNSGAGNRALWFSNATSAGAAQTLQIGEAAGESLADLAGRWCLLATWRTAAQRGMYAAPIADSASPVVKTASDVTANTNSLAGRRMTWGIEGRSSTTENYTHFIGRGFLENLAKTGRDPIAVLNAERLRIRARNLWVA